MKSFWSLVYNIFFLPALYLFLKIAGLFNQKISRGITGRKNLFDELIAGNNLLNRTGKLIWFHSASLGEFEQAKPIIEKLKNEKKENIIVTFFSPSGYENSRKYPHADIISYLPFDTKKNAEKFISIIKPDLFVMMRYDIWPNLVWKLKEMNMIRGYRIYRGQVLEIPGKAYKGGKIRVVSVEYPKPDWGQVVIPADM